jgi:ABC-type lipoprotein release transport system permease subunit
MIFTIILSLLLTSEKAINNILNNTGTHFISFRPLCCGLPYIQKSDRKQNFIANGIPSQPLPIEFLKKIQNLPEVLDASPYLLYQLHDSKRERDFTIGGFEPKNAVAVANTSCAATDLIAGRFLHENDTTAVLLEESFAAITGIRIGQNIAPGGVTLIVVGIVNPGIRPAKADMYVPYHTAEKIIGRQLEVPVKDIMNIVLVESANAHVHQKAMHEVSTLMGKESLISTYNCFKPASGAMDINKKVLGLLFALMFVFVLAFSFENQYSSIIERRHDLGILSAIGWPNKRIIFLIALESFLYISIGGLTAGILSAVLFIALPVQTIIDSTVFNNVGTASHVLAFGYVSVLCAGISSGIIPVWLMVRKIPANNLQALH